MSSVLATWVPAGAVLGLLLVGIGSLLSRAARAPLPTALLLPAGLAGVIVIANLAAAAGVPAIAVAVVLVAAALAGLWFARDRRLTRAGWWGLAAVAATWLTYTLIVALTGQATFPGYGIIGDPAIHLVGADGLPGPPGSWAQQPGAFKAFFAGYYDNGYPQGGAATLGTLSTLLGADPVRLIYPLVVIAMASLVAAAWSLLTPLVPQGWARALAAALTAFPALTAAFVLQTSLKEVLAIVVLATFFASTAALLAPGVARVAADGPAEDESAAGAPAARGRSAWVGALREALVPAVALGAAVASIGLAAGAYLAPGALVVLVAVLAVRGWRHTLLLAVALAPLAVIAVLPALLSLGGYVGVSGKALTTQAELGNLYAGPLRIREIWGVWLMNDFRLPPNDPTLTTWGANVVIAALVVGAIRLLLMAARRSPQVVPLLAWGIAVAVATPIVIDVGSPWADAKAMAIAGPTILAVAGVGVAWSLGTRWLVPIGAAAALAITGAVGGSLALASYDVGTAPQQRFDELAQIDDRFAGQGPMVSTEFEEYYRHLLRKVPVAFSFDPYYPLPVKGQYGSSSDQDDLDAATAQQFRLMLVRRGPSASRPPSNFVRRWTGRYYDVWQRDPALPAPTQHRAFGDRASGGAATPTCRTIERLAASARPGDSLVAAPGNAFAWRPFATMPLPVGWNADGGDPTVVHPYGAGRFELTLRPGVRPGELVDVWLEGSFSRRVRVIANGKVATIGPMALNPNGSSTRVVTVPAGRDGEVALTVIRPARAARTGWGNLRARWGPIAVTRHDALGRSELIRVPASQARRLCGRSLDWVEVVGR